MTGGAAIAIIIAEDNHHIWMRGSGYCCARQANIEQHKKRHKQASNWSLRGHRVRVLHWAIHAGEE